MQVYDNKKKKKTEVNLFIVINFHNKVRRSYWREVKNEKMLKIWKHVIQRCHLLTHNVDDTYRILRVYILHIETSFNVTIIIDGVSLHHQSNVLQESNVFIFKVLCRCLYITNVMIFLNEMPKKNKTKHI